MVKLLILKPDRERSVLNRHPWIFSGAIAKTSGEPQKGETVQVKSSKGENLGWAAFNPESKISARMWSYSEYDEINANFLRQKIQNAIARRSGLPIQSNALRLVYAESDGIPGLIVDQYADWIVAQFLTAGAEHWREEILQALVENTGIEQVFDRSDADVRQLEGLPQRVECARGQAPEGEIIINEYGNLFRVDIIRGHKTGFYLDQRDNRHRFSNYVAEKSILNCFSYTGAFAVYALRNGAQSVLSIDSSAQMLGLGQANLALNGLPMANAVWQEGDVFQVLRTLRDQARQFDVIVLDPPKFAPTAAQAERAARGYKDINLLALKLLSPGGYLFTFSCSGGITAELFQKIVAGAAMDAKVDAQIIEHLHQASDHPIALNFPESEYLKGLVIHKV